MLEHRGGAVHNVRGGERGSARAGLSLSTTDLIKSRIYNIDYTICIMYGVNLEIEDMIS
jgi:hypothetical protein